MLQAQKNYNLQVGCANHSSSRILISMSFPSCRTSSPQRSTTWMNSPGGLLQDTVQLDARVDPGSALAEVNEGVAKVLQLVQNNVQFGASYISRLPTELLQDILIMCMQASLSSGGLLHDSLNLNNPSWVLSHVCSEWRMAALAMPELWSFIGIDLSSYTILKMGLLKNQLLRSSSTGLTISLRNLIWGGQRCHVSDFIHIIAPHFHRCLILSLNLSPRDLLALYRGAQDLPSFFAQLHTLHFTATRDFTLMLSDPLSWLFRDAPKLRRLYSNPISSLNPPWHQLTHLAGPESTPYFSHASLLLQRLTTTDNLVYCNLAISRFDHLPNRPSITFPHLRTLELTLPTTHVSPLLKNFLDRLSTPELCSLRVRGSLSSSSISDFLQRVRHLTSLSLLGIPVVEVDGILRDTQSLEDLTLCFPHPPHVNPISQLAETFILATESLAPCLKTLTILNQMDCHGNGPAEIRSARPNVTVCIPVPWASSPLWPQPDAH